MGLLSFRERRSDVAAFDDPDHISVSNPWSTSGWMSGILGGASSSGVRVTEVTAQSVAAVFACEQVIFQTLATVPLQLYRKVDERTRERATDHRLYSTLHDEANDEMSAASFWETVGYHLVGWGHSYSEIEMNRRGDVIGLHPLLPNRTWIERKDGLRWFWTWVGRDGVRDKYVRLPAEKVLHIPGLSFDGLRSVSIVGLAKEAIGQAMAVGKFTSEWYANGAIPAVVLRHPEAFAKPDTADKIRASFDSAYSGLGKRHRTAILEEGMDLTVLSVDPEKSQMIQVQKWVLEQCCRYYRMPLHKVQSLDHATNNNIEHQDLEFHRDTMGIWYRRIEQAINRQCLGKLEKGQYYVEFLVEALLRADSAGRAALYKALVEIGAMSPNDVSLRENLPPGGPDGDRRFFPLNFGPLDKLDDLLKARHGAGLSQVRKHIAAAYEASGIELEVPQ